MEMSERRGQRGEGRVSAENGIGGYCSITLSRWENKDIGGFNTV